jgi:hypothetical protein
MAGMAVPEYIGLKTQPSPWPDGIWPAPSNDQIVNGPTLKSDSRVFIHGRDYTVLQPESYTGSWAADQSSYVRVYQLLPRVVYSSSGQPSTYPVGHPKAGQAQREDRVDKLREVCFAQELLGYPFLDLSEGGSILRRKLPEPLRWASGGNWEWQDSRGYNAGGSVTGSAAASPGGKLVSLRYESRPTHWATKIIRVQGLGERGQNPDLGTSVWPISPQGVRAEETYAAVNFHVLFEFVGTYDLMLRSDPFYGGEYSRFTLWQDEPRGRFIQVRGGVTWDTDTTHYGQPAQNNMVSGTTFASKEGQPRLQGENQIVVKWLDVPDGAYNWPRIQSMFGSVNSLDWPYPLGKSVPGADNRPLKFPTPSPFSSSGKETLLFQTAGRLRKPGIMGPLWDISFHFIYSPADDGFGAWNRLLSTKAYWQRYGIPVGAAGAGLGTGIFYRLTDFNDLFRP